VYSSNIEIVKFNLPLLTFKNSRNVNDYLDKLDKLDNKWLVGFLE